ncbi:MAG: hypothetical protein OHK0038_09130 [Flammeovirgaceae bacterium]
MFADTFDSKIGESCLSDYEKMEVEFATMARANGMKMNRLFFHDYDFTKEKLKSVLENIHCEKDDVVFFYYSGHGARAAGDESKWPQLSMGMEPKTDVQHFPLAFVDEMLAEKKPRFRFLMADCCNKTVGGITSKTSRSFSEVEESMKPSEKAYRELFRKLKGKIICTSASPGEYALGNEKGGIFTMNFLNALSESVLVGKGDWYAILDYAKKATMKDTEGFRQHTPQFEIDVQVVEASEAIVSNKPTAITLEDIQIPDELNTIDALMVLADAQKPRSERIKMMEGVLKKIFASENAKVEVYGRDGKTLLEQETATDFVKRLSTTQRLVGMVEIFAKRDENGKVKELQIHEFYKKR